MFDEPMSPPMKPLAPPRGSPAWIFKEPKEFYAQRERHLEREARKIKRLTERHALQELGHTVALVRPTVKTTIDGDPPPRFDRPHLRDVWGPPPHRLHESMKCPSLLSSKSFGIKKQASPVAHYLEDQRAIIGGERARISEEMWRTLKGWSRGNGGNPWTLKQVYAEVEADVHHQKARDTRAKCGHMGPNEVGLGATTRRREMVAFERNWNAARSPASTAGDGFAASPSPSSGSMSRSNTMPALTQSAS